jgi:hypothetical protein
MIGFVRQFLLLTFGIILIGIVSSGSRNDEYFMEFDADWRYSDVRLIDPIDTPQVENDLIAVLCRYKADFLQIRLDFLDFKNDQGYDIFIYIDEFPTRNLHLDTNANLPDTSAWDYIVSVPFDGQIFMTDRLNIDISGIKLRVSRDTDQNSVVVGIGADPRLTFSGSVNFWVVISIPGSREIYDQTSIINLNGIPPLPIKLSFIFWNAFDGSTPATALRSWDGAHTGPQSSRHGLRYLLKYSSVWNTPITICDFQSKIIWSALEYMEIESEIYRQINDGILNLSYCINSNDYAQSASILTINTNPSGVYQSILSEAVNRYFNDPSAVIRVGGDFSISGLGSPETINLLFGYIARHPWIRVTIDPVFYDYESFSPTHSLIGINEIPHNTFGQSIVSGMTTLELQARIVSAIRQTPGNNLSELSIDIYNNILSSTQANVILDRGSYFSQLGHVLAAAVWADKPVDISSCDLDIDWDGQPECVLATKSIFLTFELDGGYLAFGFAVTPSGNHQIIGGTTQYGVCRSDPSSFLNDRGIITDPGQIPGALADPFSNWSAYIGTPTESQMVLENTNGNIRKTFSINGNEIRINIEGIRPSEQPMMYIPLSLDPWLRFEPDWGDIFWSKLLDPYWYLGASDKFSLSVQSSVEFRPYTFNATRYAIRSSEDPNYDYTPGHLLPFPMALVEIQTEPSFNLTLVVDPEINFAVLP